MLLVDLDGNIVSGSDNQEIGKQVEYAKKLNGYSGTIRYGKYVLTYQKVGEWNYYLISVSSAAEMYRAGITTAILIAVLVLVLIVICTSIAGRLLSHVYAPLDEVVKEMATVSNGCMDVRINAEALGKGFEEMAEGFNTMMEKLCDAMQEVKNKQEQIAQTKLNALQSQIQPHFLYNTLECIHWQAVAEGNKEISTLVKALASYYRICLSKGKDIIPLEEELQHIRYYMMIQNMRSDQTIELDIQVAECYNHILLPKLML